MKTIQLLLTENVDNLGIVGDVVKVKPGYARNFLMPFGLVTVPSDGNIKRLAERRAQVEVDLKAQRGVMEKVLEKLTEYELTIERHANEQGVLFGGVSQHDIAEALREAGFAVDDRAVRIGIQIKRLDSYEIPIVLADDLKTDIKLWVVSDRPMETNEQEEEGKSEEAQEQEASAEAQEDSA